MPLGDWATGTMLRPLRAITEFDSLTGQVSSSVFECEVWSPLNRLIKTDRFQWIPRSPGDAATVQQLAAEGVADIMTAEGMVPFVTPT